MDKKYLEYILVLAETGNMTRAAEKLYITQPTLSQFLSKKERELGMPLFQRSNGIYTLTPAGSLYAEYARKVLTLTENLEKDMKRISTARCIRIGTSSSRAIQMCTFISADFRKYYPNVELISWDGNLEKISHMISKGEIDIAFVAADSLDQYKNCSKEIQKEEVVFAASSSHPFCRRLEQSRTNSLTSRQLLETFGNSPFILQHKGACIRYLIDSFFDKQNFNPIVACSISHVQSICEMVADNIGVGFIPIGYAEPSPLITYFHLEPNMYRIHSFLYRKDLIMEAPHIFLLQLAQEYIDKNWNFDSQL